MKRINNLGYFISEGFHSIFTHGLMSFAAVCMIVACLLIMGSFTLVAVNLGEMLGDMERDTEFLAYVDETLSEEEIAALGERLRQLPNVASVEFATKEEAKTAYVNKYANSGNADLFAELPDNAFRDRYLIRVVDIEQFAQTVQAVRNTQGVGGDQAAPEIAQGLVVIRNVAAAVALVLVAMLLVMSIFIIANTTKLATFTRRDEIAIMKMVGATNGFIRWPFVVEGIILGLFGAVVAFFLEWGLYTLVREAVNASDVLQLVTVIPFVTVAPWVLAAFAGVGLIVGVFGSAVTIGKFLQV